MTEEEIAEEYENAQDYCSLLDVLLEEQYNQDYGGLSCYISPYIEQAFLAGLKAGKPRWHKVKSGDLPPEDSKVLAFMAGGEVCIAHFYRKNVWDKIGIVIAWCEIPQYTEE